MRVLTPAGVRGALRFLGGVTARYPGLLDAANYALGGLLEHVALRTAAIDAALRREGSIPQLVILGAGLDARAFRMPELGRTIVFEVDFPSTQEVKKSRVETLPRRASEVRFVPIDFEREALSDVLDRAGHRAAERTVWIWEGVTMYLERTAIEATLDVIAARSFPGSSLLMTYGTAGARAPGSPLEKVMEWTTPLAFSALRWSGEPLRGQMSRHEAHELLRMHELEPNSDTGSRDWAAAHFRGRPSAIVIDERLVRAVRR
jgi:methyltransferase (TIGR00027 family)